MVSFFTRNSRKNPNAKGVARNNNKTVIILSDSKIYSLRVNPFFQAFLLFSAVIISAFLTYHITIYVKAQSNLQEKDHKIFIGEAINKNLTTNLRFVIGEINKINSMLNDLNVPKKDEKRKPAEESSKIPNKITNEEEFDVAKKELKSKIINLDKEIDKRVKTLTSLIYDVGLHDVLKKNKIYNYEDYKSHNFVAKNINYSAMDIASAALSEAKYKLQYLRNVQDFMENLPITKPMKGVRITSGYGVRFHPVLKLKLFHHGIDFKGPPKATIHATADSKVKFSGFSNSFGNVVILDHGNDIISIYAHMSSAKVKTGQIIKRDDIIGLQGNTGRSTGEHLHYEVRYKGQSVNPIKFLQMNEVLRKSN